MLPKNLKLKTRLLTAFAIPLLVIVFMAITIYTSVNSLLAANAWVNHTSNVISKGRGLLSNMVDMETGMRGYLVAGRDEFLAPYHSGQQAFNKDIGALKQTVNDNPRQVSWTPPHHGYDVVSLF